MVTGTAANLMPNTFNRQRRWAFVLGMLAALAIVTITLSIVVYLLRGDVRDLGLAGRTSQAATCYASARGRPALIQILRVIAGSSRSVDERQIVNDFIDGYEDNTPTLEECDTLARMLGFSPEDFPPPDVPRQRTEEREDTNP